MTEAASRRKLRVLGWKAKQGAIDEDTHRAQMNLLRRLGFDVDRPIHVIKDYPRRSDNKPDRVDWETVGPERAMNDKSMRPERQGIDTWSAWRIMRRRERRRLRESKDREKNGYRGRTLKVGVTSCPR